MTEPSKRPKANTDKQDNMDDAGFEARLASLDERLKSIRAQQKEEKKPNETAGETSNAIGQALRLSAEFVSGILAGGAIGWAIDRLFDTSPWGLMVCLLLGSGAGMLNLFRAARISVTSRDGDKS